ncbi:hypothetical protein ACI3LY_003224 [Candidozyma auris]|uniref:4-hydroxy-4-methyl-2-oxoglutarate aldolase n=2 Tax=Candidozyma auris TaxID=498019 RepID=A0AB36W6Y2_CANAR|nr:hypothetical protein QG37_07820 [[Candida] auris]PIS52416.1 hypothetical protein B9J08_004032 [[Candida] auris]PIS54291.1 hypothetical protein CJI97_003992 [[Candida] auris]QWW21416.1 hypothetical protein CA7LBN_000162 [[Candida] auris]
MSVRATLAKYTPCDVSDALVAFGLKNGGFIPNLVQRSPIGNSPNKGYATAVGQAYTVLYAPKSDPRPAVKQSYIDEIPKDSMLVMAVTEELQQTSAPFVKVNNALYGGLMSTRANYREAAGSVILGRIRDLAEHNDLNYPVWSYGVGTTAGQPVVKVVGINVPVSVKVTSVNGEEEKITVLPNDWVVADENGVVRIPIDHRDGAEAEIKLDKVLEYIPKRVEADTNVSKDIKAGKPAAESQKFWRGKI